MCSTRILAVVVFTLSWNTGSKGDEFSSLLRNVPFRAPPSHLWQKLTITGLSLSFTLCFFFKISFDSPLNHRSHIKLGDLPVHLNGSHDSLFSYLLDPFSLLTFGRIPPLSLTSLVSCSTLFTPEFILHFHLIVLTCPPSMNSCSFTVYVPKACLILTL